jgi:acetyl-CoA acyltransferase 2
LVLGIFIVAAKRTPFGTYGGKFVKTSSTELQVVAAKAALAAGNVDPNIVDSVIIGNVLIVSLINTIVFILFVNGRYMIKIPKFDNHVIK